MSSRSYEIAETATFQKTIQKSNDLGRIYRKIVDVVYPLLRREPHFGPNIKRLKAEYSDFYRYRIGDYRLFYTIGEHDVVVVVAYLRSRGEAYKR